MTEAKTRESGDKYPSKGAYQSIITIIEHQIIILINLIMHKNIPSRILTEHWACYFSSSDGYWQTIYYW